MSDSESTETKHRIAQLDVEAMIEYVRSKTGRVIFREDPLVIMCLMFHAAMKQDIETQMEGFEDLFNAADSKLTESQKKLVNTFNGAVNAIKESAQLIHEDMFNGQVEKYKDLQTRFEASLIGQIDSAASKVVERVNVEVIKGVGRNHLSLFFSAASALLSFMCLLFVILMSKGIL
jgi:uncharacterized protein YdbL (DUF1318 family)